MCHPLRPQRMFLLELASVFSLSTMVACSSGGSPADPVATGGTFGSGGSGGSSGSGAGASSAGGGGLPSADAVVGTFSVTLNPALDEFTPAYTTVFGTVYSAEYPTDIVETPISSEGGCTTYQFSRHSCFEPLCTGAQKCAAPNDCRETPNLVSVGTVSLTGLGAAPLTLSAINNNYQYAGDIVYPGVDDGGTVTLSATGGHYPAFTVTTTGVAPATLLASSYLLSSGQPLVVEWEKGANTEAEVSVLLNISKHGGSAGYLKCDTTDTGSLTIPVEPIQRLIALGVAGYPQLTFARRARGEAAVTAGKIALDAVALAIPALAVEGYCSCFDSSDCGSCEDTTKTACDSVRKLCHAP